MAFFGCFGGGKEARRRFDERSAYLFAPVLDFSLDGKVALCFHGGGSQEERLLFYPSLFIASDAKGRTAAEEQTLARLYYRYGKRMRKALSPAVSFAVYDTRSGVLLLGGTGGKKCYLDEWEGSVFFSSEPWLLRKAVAVDLAMLR